MIFTTVSVGGGAGGVEAEGGPGSSARRELTARRCKKVRLNAVDMLRDSLSSYGSVYSIYLYSRLLATSLR